MSKAGSGMGNALTIGCLSFLAWLLFIVLHICEIQVKGLYAVGWAFFLLFVTFVAIARHTVRMYHQMNGNVAEDFFCALFLYPAVATQLEYAMLAGGKGIAPLMPIPRSQRSKKSDADGIVIENKATEAGYGDSSF